MSGNINWLRGILIMVTFPSQRDKVVLHAEFLRDGGPVEYFSFLKNESSRAQFHIR